MEYIFNVATWFLVYISVPLSIRYIFLRKPIDNKWIAIAVLAVLFIIFGVIGNIIREQVLIDLADQTGIPYRQRTHMFGSIPLYIAMIFSYYILRKAKNTSGEDIIGNAGKQTPIGEHILESKEREYKEIDSSDNNVENKRAQNSNTLDVPTERDLERYYEILGVERGATRQEIKDAYYDLIGIWRSDKHVGDQRLYVKSINKLKEIDDAYSIIIHRMDNAQNMNHINSSEVQGDVLRNEPMKYQENLIKAESDTVQSHHDNKEESNTITSNIRFVLGALALIIGILTLIGLVSNITSPRDNIKQANVGKTVWPDVYAIRPVWNGEYDRAIEELTNKIKKYPNDSVISGDYLSRGIAYYHKGYYDLAIADFANVKNRYYQDLLPYWVGMAYSKIGREEEAIKHIRISASAGYREAQEYLTSKNINW